MIKFLLNDIQIKGCISIVVEDGCLNYTAKIIDYDFSSFNKEKWFIIFVYDACKHIFYNDDIINYKIKNNTCYIECIL